MNDGADTTRRTPLDARWDLFHRWGPGALLVIGSLVSAATADLLMSATGRRAAVVLVAVGVMLQLGWDRIRERHRGPSAAGAVYYFLRWAVAFALTWLNPFFAFYAAIGYFGAERLLPRRWLKAGLFASAVIMSGSQSGGLPPKGPVGWVVLGAVLVVNLLLLSVFGHFAAQEEEQARVQAETIGELESANARLRQALDENAALHAQLLLQAREAGVADERRRLAAEIHDTIAQGLAGIIAQLQVVAVSEDPGLVREHLLRAQDLARHSLGEARRSVQNLSPLDLEHDLLPDALKRTVEEWGARHGVRADFTVTGTLRQLHTEIEATLLRVAQEALSNAGRHAGASRVGVTLSFMGDEVSLDVRDDGRGFDPVGLPPRTATAGFGLDGMRARTERIAGSVTVESEPGHGTAVSARVPLVPHDR
ncbi:sensor histidine kinase [Streptomyces sp. NBC_00536]|uniref:sensor histidine kinase n=1 Tax=Streptomyces sp. NBC_00536 TaxID=2975769 RepID=UPI002E8218E9|nr:sensor histidine kinase [Streptomyces sp. NBC_00536]WUC77189.1 sensor histidine kinase [Streptomyces sp. NBC_00536]